MHGNTQSGDPRIHLVGLKGAFVANPQWFRPINYEELVAAAGIVYVWRQQAKQLLVGKQQWRLRERLAEMLLYGIKYFRVGEHFFTVRRAKNNNEGFSQWTKHFTLDS